MSYSSPPPEERGRPTADGTDCTDDCTNCTTDGAEGSSTAVGADTASAATSGGETARESRHTGRLDGPVVSVEWRVVVADGVSLVTVQVRNPASVPRMVRIENRLDGPTLPPRRARIPEAGWDGDQFEAVVEADATRPIGYASTAVATDVPIALEDDPVASDCPARENEVSAADAVRRLGDHAPPATAVPAATTPDAAAVGGESAVSGKPTRPSPPPSPSGVPPDGGRRAAAGSSRHADGATDERAWSVEGPGRSRDNGSTVDRQTLKMAVDAWLDAVDARLALADSLATDDAVTATTTLGRLGGADGAAVLAAALEADAATLRETADRIENQLDAVEAVDVPVDELERIA